MDIPKKGWFVRKQADKPAHLSEVYFNGERVGRIRKLKLGMDAEFPLVTLELELVGPDLAVEIIQDLEAQRPAPIELKTGEGGTDIMTWKEAQKLVNDAFEAEEACKDK
jgi:hypothetical protein